MLDDVTVSFMSSLQLFLLKFEHLSGLVFIRAEESEVSVSVCSENMKREMERDMRESHSENLEHYVMLAHTHTHTPSLPPSPLCSFRALIGPSPSGL